MQALLPFDKAMHNLGDIGRTKLYQLIDAGKITRVKIGARSFVTAKSLNDYVDSLTAEAVTR